MTRQISSSPSPEVLVEPAQFGYLYVTAGNWQRGLELLDAATQAMNAPPATVRVPLMFAVAMLLLAVIGFLTGRPDFLDLAIVYGLLNVVGTIAVLKFFRYGDLGEPGDEDTTR